MASDVPALSAEVLKSICDMWSGWDSGLVGHEMGVILRDLGIDDVLPATSKAYRLYSALSHAQEATDSGERVVAFIEKVMSPVRYAENPEKFDERRTRINRTLAFVGLKVEDDGRVVATDRTFNLAKPTVEPQSVSIGLSRQSGVNTSEVWVFISYSREDKALVRHVYEALIEGGVNVWFDQEQIEPGNPNWERAIREAIDQAKFVLYMASESAKDSQYVRDELQIARDKNKTVIPFWISGDVWSDCIPLGLGSHQRIDARGAQYGVGLIMLAKRLGMLGIPH